MPGSALFAPHEAVLVAHGALELPRRELPAARRPGPARKLDLARFAGALAPRAHDVAGAPAAVADALSTRLAPLDLGLEQPLVVQRLELVERADMLKPDEALRNLGPRHALRQLFAKVGPQVPGGRALSRPMRAHGIGAGTHTSFT